ncbi:MAG: hypothetical protein LQ338_004779 [Usnochroma carphineum]|nr:MAG: hypothetical protein LQ338_004779 [Usnochroma carphineum]
MAVVAQTLRNLGVAKVRKGRLLSIEHQTTQDRIRIEQDDTINQRIRQIEQHIRREAQQQGNMTRPGQQRINVFDQIEETELNTFESALAADSASGILLQLQEKGEVQRPCTPPTPLNNCESLSFQSYNRGLADEDAGQFPITPDTSPFKVGSASHAMARSRTFDATPTKSIVQLGNVDICINPAESMQRSLSYPNDKSSLEAELSRPLNTEQTHPALAGLAPPPSAFFPNMNTLNVGFTTKCSDGYDSSNYSPMSSALTPLMSSFESSPEMTGMSLFDSTGGLPDLSLLGTAPELSSSQSSQHISAYPSPPKERMHRRTQSAVTVDEIDGTNEETGITEDEISAYITGPLQDNRYMCTYEGCNKLFGRKENIRSHVQTHLGDRQWRCNHCHKRFVRQHDLKRHAKIHSGQKPHQCPCGNGFARHDALTRHRQRNTCIGGFGVAEGIPQSPSKRGRPKKRPDMESRREKAAKTRDRALEKARASSVSGSSAYSAPSPQMFFEELTTSGMRHADNMVTIQSVEADEVLEAINAMSPEMIEDFFRDVSKGSSPFSELEDGNLFGADKNVFDVGSTYDPTSQWL